MSQARRLAESAGWRCKACESGVIEVHANDGHEGHQGSRDWNRWDGMLLQALTDEQVQALAASLDAGDLLEILPTLAHKFFGVRGRMRVAAFSLHR